MLETMVTPTLVSFREETGGKGGRRTRLIEYFLTQAVGCDPRQDKDNNEQALTSEGLILRLTSEVKPKVFFVLISNVSDPYFFGPSRIRILTLVIEKKLE